MREKDAKAVEMKKEIASLKDAVAKKDEDLETLKVKRQEELQKEEDDRMDIENKATDERRNFNIEQCKLKDRIKKKDLELRHCQAARDRLASDVQERESDVADLREQLGAAQQEVRFLKCRLRDKEDLIEMLKPTASLLPRTDAGKGLSLQATRDKRPLKAASRSRPLEAERGNRFKTSQEKQVKEKESLQANARREEASTEVGRRSRHLRKEAKSERRVESRPREATRQNRASRTVERNKTRKQKSEDESEQESEDESEQESGDESEQESEDESEQESEDESGVSFRESEDESAGERGRVSAGERVAGERGESQRGRAVSASLSRRARTSLSRRARASLSRRARAKSHPLIDAAEEGREEVVEVLVAAGADVSLKDNRESLLLMAAAGLQPHAPAGDAELLSAPTPQGVGGGRRPVPDGRARCRAAGSHRGVSSTRSFQASQ
ncbi:hypothetical protein C7M84_006654 [Penaeus vannamei]|uniref:Uncharacterized protein n=1 Tax=Penaeus vannamei TaxID=6689 RepID=A0A3R7N1M7_PENVA|nr:hypothetical protein C7M84_006654 [Penaeus vannamei]